MKKILLVILIFFGSVTMLSAAKFQTKIEPLAGEKWYGAYTAQAWPNTPLNEIQFQPFEANFEKTDLATENLGNQAAPFLLSNVGRYVWSDEPFAFEFKNGILILHSDAEKINAVNAGKTLREAYRAASQKHFPASGKTPNPLMFKIPQYNTWIELGTNQNQQDVMKYAENVLKNNFPPGVFMIDDIWQKYYGNFEFDAAKFHDPKGMVDSLHAEGFRVMLWVTPFISADSKEFRFLEKNGGLVMNTQTNSPVLIKWWNGYSACLDLSKNFAFSWLKKNLKSLQDLYSIDGFKFDAADFHFYTDYPTNTSGNLQSELYAKLGTEFGFNEFRACWKMGNQPLAQRLQDKAYSWDDLNLLIPDMISAGLIGHPFTCPDMIGGGLIQTFENIDYNKFDQELMIRSAQLQALMPMMQFSVAPWRVLDKKHLTLCRNVALLHAKMGDYILALAKQAAKDGEPIIRHMEYVFPHEGFETCKNQYMLGDEYLVAPMINKGRRREVKLPKGKWIDERGKKYKGGKTVTIDVPLSRLPYFKLQK